MNKLKILGIIGVIITIIVVILEAIRMIKLFFGWVVIGMIVVMLGGLAIGYIRKKVREDEKPSPPG